MSVSITAPLLFGLFTKRSSVASAAIISTIVGIIVTELNLLMIIKAFGF